MRSSPCTVTMLVFSGVLRSPEPYGAHEDGPEASIRGAVCAKPRGRRKAGERDPREFEFRYNVRYRYEFSMLTICNVATLKKVYNADNRTHSNTTSLHLYRSGFGRVGRKSIRRTAKLTTTTDVPVAVGPFG